MAIEETDINLIRANIALMNKEWKPIEIFKLLFKIMHFIERYYC